MHPLHALSQRPDLQHEIEPEESKLALLLLFATKT